MLPFAAAESFCVRRFSLCCVSVASHNVGCVAAAELIILHISGFHCSVMSATLYLCARVRVLGTCVALDSDLN